MNVIVTGAGSGIGKEVVKRFLQEENTNVLAVSRNSAKLDALIQECGNQNLRTLELDFVDFDSNEIKLGEALNGMGEVDILINNAGMLLNKNFLDVTVKDMNEQWTVNFVGAARMIQHCVPYMEVTNGKSHIINVSSMGGYQGSAKFPGLSIYSSSKGALSILTECLAEEFADKSISVNALAFGAVQTEMLEKAFPEFKAPISAEEMAGFVVEFAMNGHRYMNGKVLPVSISTP